MNIDAGSLFILRFPLSNAHRFLIVKTLGCFNVDEIKVVLEPLNGGSKRMYSH